MTRPFVIDINHANNVQDTRARSADLLKPKPAGSRSCSTSHRGLTFADPRYAARRAAWMNGIPVPVIDLNGEVLQITPRFAAYHFFHGQDPVRRSGVLSPDRETAARRRRRGRLGGFARQRNPAERRCGRRFLQHRRERAWLSDHCLFGQCRQGATAGQGSALCQATPMARRLQHYLVGSADVGQSVALAEQRRQSRQRAALHSRDRRQLRQFHRRRADDRQATRRRLGRRRAAGRDRGRGAQAAPHHRSIFPPSARLPAMAGNRISRTSATIPTPCRPASCKAFRPSSICARSVRLSMIKGKSAVAPPMRSPARSNST